MKNLVAQCAVLAICFSFNSRAFAGFLPPFVEKSVKIIAAPVTAPVEAVKDLASGKPPSVESIVKVASPTAAQVLEGDKQFKVTPKLEAVVHAPEKANQAFDAATQAAKAGEKAALNADNEIGKTEMRVKEFTTAIRAEVRKFFESVSAPANLVLWLLAAFLGVKTLKTIFGSPRRHAA